MIRKPCLLCSVRGCNSLTTKTL